MGIKDYLNQIIGIYQYENLLCHYLDVTTYEPILALLDETLLKDHLNYYIKNQLSLILNNQANGNGNGNGIDIENLNENMNKNENEKKNENDIDIDTKTLKTLFYLSGRIDSLEEFAEIFGVYNKIEGTLLSDMQKFGFTTKDKFSKISIINPSIERSIIVNILKFYKKNNSIVSNCFNNNKNFEINLRKNTSRYLNIYPNHVSILLSKYIHQLFRLKTKLLSEEIILKKFQNCIDLLQHLDAIDMFKAFYKHDLAKRLLLNSYSSYELEKTALSLLNKHFGLEFVRSIEIMFNDVKNGRKLYEEYRRMCSYFRKDFQLNNFDVIIITSGFWPHYKNIKLALPIEFEKEQSAFERYYCSKTRMRKLTWMYTLGTASLRYSINKSEYILNVSMIQATLLLLFNQKESYSFKEIQISMNCDPCLLSRHLLSLISSKSPLLVLNQKNDYNASDKLLVEKSFFFKDEAIFSLNKAFHRSHTRIYINKIQVNSSWRAVSNITKKVYQERKMAIDANIVRILKKQKCLPHKYLITELYKSLKFPMEKSEIKQRISSLIERDYIERDDNDHNVYRYLA